MDGMKKSGKTFIPSFMTVLHLVRGIQTHGNDILKMLVFIY